MELTIVNGMAMYNLIKDGTLNITGEVAPFNEAMCQGIATEDIFSSEFIDERAHALHVVREDYEEIVLAPLSPLFAGDYDELTLYFDSDMFCMINLLTILAYLDRNNYEGQLQLMVIDYDYTVLKQARISPIGFHSLYVATVVKHLAVNVQLPSELSQGIALYLDYASGVSRVDQIIESNPRMEAEALLGMVMKMAPEYGLGDTQIAVRIESKRARS